MRLVALLTLAAAIACEPAAPADEVASPVDCAELVKCTWDTVDVYSCEEDLGVSAEVCGVPEIVAEVDLPVNAEGVASITAQYEDGGTDGRSLLAFTGDCAAPGGPSVYVHREGRWDFRISCQVEGETIAQEFRMRADVHSLDLRPTFDACQINPTLTCEVDD